MRTFAITLVCTTAVTLTALPGRLAAQGFEGIITSHMTMEGGHTVEVVYQVKGNKARWESHSPGWKRWAVQQRSMTSTRGP